MRSVTRQLDRVLEKADPDCAQGSLVPPSASPPPPSSLPQLARPVLTDQHEHLVALLAGQNFRQHPVHGLQPAGQLAGEVRHIRIGVRGLVVDLLHAEGLIPQ